MNQPTDGRVMLDDAFPVYRQRCTELFDENMLLRSQVAGLKRQVSELTQLVPPQTPEPEPGYGGPDLTTQPPYPDNETT